MSFTQRIACWVAVFAVIGLILESGWLIASAMHQTFILWIAVAANIAVTAYAGWTKWKRRAEERVQKHYDRAVS